MALDHFYQGYILYILYILLFLIIILLNFIQWKPTIITLSKIKRSTWVYLIIIFLVGSFIRLFVFPHYHQMYIDEPWYLDAAKNFKEKQRPLICDYDFNGNELCKTIPKPPGWPFLISIAYRIFGVSNYTALYLSSILGSLSIILIFLLSYLLFNNQKIALWASFLLAFTPIYVLWSNSAETNNPSLFFVLLSFMFFILYLKTKEKLTLTLTILIVIFATSVRHENIILSIIFFLAYVGLFKDSGSTQLKFHSYYPLATILALFFIVFIEHYFIKLFRPNFLNHIADYYYLNLFTFLETISFNYIYLALMVAIFFSNNEKYKAQLSFILSSLIIFLVLYLPLFFESRMALLPGLFAIILSAYSLENITKFFKNISLARAFIVIIFVILFIISLNSTYIKIYMYDSNKILETESVMKIAHEIPKNCYIISEFPQVVTSISNLRGLQTRDILKNPKIIAELENKGICIYYFYDGYCRGLPISPSYQSSQRCQRILEMFEHKEEKKLKNLDAEFFLFKLHSQG